MSRRFDESSPVPARTEHRLDAQPFEPGDRGALQRRIDLLAAELAAAEEELQALTGELGHLHAANDQLHSQIETQAALIDASESMTLVLEASLQLRWYSRAAEALFPLRPSDLGRFIGDLAPRFHDPALLDDLREAAAGGGLLQAEVEAVDGRWYARRIWRQVLPRQPGVRLVLSFVDITERRVSQAALYERSNWLMCQRQALEAGLAGADLVTSLGMLVQSATRALGPDMRAAFFLADEGFSALHHVVGMPEEYAMAVDGFAIGANSLACGLAAHLGEPILSTDVQAEERWQPWLHLAEVGNYRSCWSFPVRTLEGVRLGTFALYTPRPRAATERVVELATLVTHTAAVLISHCGVVQARTQALDRLEDIRGRHLKQSDRPESPEPPQSPDDGAMQ